MSNDIQTIPANLNQWEAMKEQAQAMVDSGFFPVKSAAQALAILMLGRELGFQPMQSMRSIDVINGKPVINAGGMASMVQSYCNRHGGYLRQVALDNDRCTIEYRRPEWPEPQQFTFSMEDAQQAGLLKNQVWRQHPRNMLYARAVTNACRMGWPEVVAGIYDPEELNPSAVDLVVDQPRLREWPRHDAEQEMTASEEVIGRFLVERVDERTGEIQQSGPWTDVKTFDVAYTDEEQRENALVQDKERTAAQKRFFAMLNERGITEDERHALQRMAYGVASFKDLTTAQVRGLTDRISQRTNEELRKAIAESAPDALGREEGPNRVAEPVFLADVALDFIQELEAAQTWEEAKLIAQEATALGISTSDLERAKAEAWKRLASSPKGAVVEVG